MEVQSGYEICQDCKACWQQKSNPGHLIAMSKLRPVWFLQGLTPLNSHTEIEVEPIFLMER